MGAMMATLHEELLDRRAQLAQAMDEVGGGVDLARLLGEVDRALERYGSKEFGKCVLCGEAVGQDELAASPLARYCLCELTPERLHKLEDDLRLAWQIQSGLLPEQGLVVGEWQTHFRYAPAGHVSGDYCDLVVRDADGSLFFMVGDVAGKGVAASVLMAHLHALLRSLVDSGRELAGMVEEANRLFARSSGPGRYATLVVGRALSDGEIEVCNAGHVPPLLLCGGEIQRLGSHGFPVGMFEASPYRAQRLRLQPGETLFLYTDGIIEARNGRRGELGVDGLSAALQAAARATPAALAAACLRAVAAHRAGTEQEDDLTMLVVRRAA